MVECSMQQHEEGDWVCGFDEGDDFCTGYHCDNCLISLCSSECGDEYCARTRCPADKENNQCMLCAHPLEDEEYDMELDTWVKNDETIVWDGWSFSYPSSNKSPFETGIGGAIHQQTRHFGRKLRKGAEGERTPELQAYYDEQKKKDDFRYGLGAKYPQNCTFCMVAIHKGLEDGSVTQAEYDEWMNDPDFPTIYDCARHNYRAEGEGKTRTFKITDIWYDTYDEEYELWDGQEFIDKHGYKQTSEQPDPSEMTITLDEDEGWKNRDLDMELADAISDESGFCVYHYNWDEITSKSAETITDELKWYEENYEEILRRKARILKENSDFDEDEAENEAIAEIYPESFEAPRSCTHCGESGHNQRTCKNKRIPFSLGGWWTEEYNGTKKGFPLVDATHVTMVTPFIHGEPLREENGARWPEIDYFDELPDTTWGELKQKIKDNEGDLLKLGDATYSSHSLDGNFRYLPTDTILSMRNGPNYPIEFRFNYKGQNYGVVLAPRIEDRWNAEGLEFTDWAKQETKHHGKTSLKDWADHEIKTHGKSMSFQDWAKHEDKSHIRRFGAEEYIDFGLGGYHTVPLPHIEFMEDVTYGDDIQIGFAINEDAIDRWDIQVNDRARHGGWIYLDRYPEALQALKIETGEWLEKNGFDLKDGDYSHGEGWVYWTFPNSAIPTPPCNHSNGNWKEDVDLVGDNMVLDVKCIDCGAKWSGSATLEEYGAEGEPEPYEKIWDDYPEPLEDWEIDALQRDLPPREVALDEGTYEWIQENTTEDAFDGIISHITHWFNKYQKCKEQFGAEESKGFQFKKDSCCCGATKSNPCACMIQGVMKCSDTCPCSLWKELREGNWGLNEIGKSKLTPEESERLQIYGAETSGAKADREDSWEKGVIRLAISSGCFSDEYAEWVLRQIDGASATLNNRRFKEIIDKRWGLNAENWGGDPEGKLALALQKARDKAKELKKPLKIEKLGAEDVVVTDIYSMKKWKLVGKKSNGTPLWSKATQTGKVAKNARKYTFGDYGAGWYDRVVKGERQHRHKTQPKRTEKELMGEIYENYTCWEYGPENLWEDGEASPSRVRAKLATSKRKIKIAEKELGRKVSYDEAIEWAIANGLEKWRAETSGQWEIGEQLEEAQMNAESFEAQAPRGHKMMTAALGKKIPPLYSQDGNGDEAIVYAHYFNPYGIGEWWILEWDGKDEMFGYADLGFPELGYISLSELENVSIGGMELPIERDLHWREKTLGEVKQAVSKYRAESFSAPKGKGINLFIEPFEEMPLDSGNIKKVIVGLGIGITAILAYNKWK